MTKSKTNFFEVIRAGINSTFQDSGRKNLNHIGIPISGAMDKRNYVHTARDNFVACSTTFKVYEM